MGRILQNFAKYILLGMDITVRNKASSLPLEVLASLHCKFHSITHFHIFISSQSTWGTMINRSLSKYIPFYSHLLPPIHLQGCLSTSWWILWFLALWCCTKLLKPVMDLSTPPSNSHWQAIVHSWPQLSRQWEEIWTRQQFSRLTNNAQVWLILGPGGVISIRPQKATGKILPGRCGYLCTLTLFYIKQN